MSKLLSANFIRLKKDKFFWSGLVFMLAAGIFFPVMRYMDMRQTQTINRIDNGFFGCSFYRHCNGCVLQLVHWYRI